MVILLQRNNHLIKTNDRNNQSAENLYYRAQEYIIHLYLFTLQPSYHI